VNACRDFKDNFLLSLCRDGKADFLITGDPDLLVIKKFEKKQKNQRRKDLPASHGFMDRGV